MGDFLLDLSGQSHWWRTDARQLEPEPESEGFRGVVGGVVGGEVVGGSWGGRGGVIQWNMRSFLPLHV